MNCISELHQIVNDVDEIWGPGKRIWADIRLGPQHRRRKPTNWWSLGIHFNKPCKTCYLWRLVLHGRQDEGLDGMCPLDREMWWWRNGQHGNRDVIITMATRAEVMIRTFVHRSRCSISFSIVARPTNRRGRAVGWCALSHPTPTALDLLASGSSKNRYLQLICEFFVSWVENAPTPMLFSYVMLRFQGGIRKLNRKIFQAPPDLAVSIIPVE